MEDAKSAILNLKYFPYFFCQITRIHRKKNEANTFKEKKNPLRKIIERLYHIFLFKEIRRYFKLEGNIWMLLNKFRTSGFLFSYLITNENYRKGEIAVKVYNYEYKVSVKITAGLYLWVKRLG